MKLIPTVYLLFVVAISSVAALGPKKIIVAFGEYIHE
jgi:hypothetical protein